jgi:hypothetical protein
MGEDRPLGRVIDAIQDVQTTFRDFYHDKSGAVDALRQHAHIELGALDTSLKHIDHLIQTLYCMDSWGAQLEFVHSNLADLVSVPFSGTQISVAESIISDMNELKQQLFDISRISKTEGSPIFMKEVFRRDLASICGMVERYRSMM